MKIKLCCTLLMVSLLTYPSPDDGDQVYQQISNEIISIMNYVVKSVDRMASENNWPEGECEGHKRKMRYFLFKALCDIRNVKLEKARKHVKSKC